MLNQGPTAAPREFTPPGGSDVTRKFLLAAAVLLASRTAAAQMPEIAQQPMSPKISMGELRPTQEMWFYQQELERYNDPRQAVRKKAEFRTAQRQARLAALSWFGYSNSRPSWSTSSHGGHHAGHWGGNSYDPLHWTGTGSSHVWYHGNGGIHGVW
jgi:hypothetical protein